MKRVMGKGTMALILGIMVCLAICGAGLATAEGPLALDSEHVYEGMNAPYADGYRPAVADGQASFVVPLVAAIPDAVQNGAVEAWLDLGAPAQSPFVYAAYRKRVPLETHRTTDEQTVEGYLISFSVPLAAQAAPGTYPVAVCVRYTPAGATQPVGERFDLAVTLPGTAPTPTPIPTAAPTPEATLPPAVEAGGTAGAGGTAAGPQPKVILDQYASTPEAVMAGETATLQLTFVNTSGKSKVRNLTIDCLPESEDLLLADQKGTYYYDSLGAGKQVELCLSVQTRLQAEAKPHRIRLALSYEDATGTACTAEAFATLDVRQPIRLLADKVNLPATLYSGDSAMVTMQVMNMGQDSVYNVLCTLEAPGLLPQSAAYLGNLASGTAQTAEILTVAGTLDMDAQGAVEDGAKVGKYGPTEGVMRITYEDAYGQSYTEEIPVQSVIQAPLYTTLAAQPADGGEEDAGKVASTQWWASVFVLAGLLIGLAAFLTYRRKVQRLKRKYGDENL